MSDTQRLNEAAQMVRELSNDDLGKLYRMITLDKRLLYIPQEYIKKLRQTKDLLSVYFDLVLDKNIKKETYEKFIPTIHELLLELGQTPSTQINYTNTPIVSVEEKFEQASNAAQTTDPVSVYQSLYYYYPRIDEALAAVGQAHKIQKINANAPTENKNNNNNNNDEPANVSRQANKNRSKGANTSGSGGGKKRKTRKNRKTKKHRNH